MPEAKSAAVALAGAIILGSLVGTAMPTHMKPAIGPDWRECYGIEFDPSAATFYVEPPPQDLTPVSDPYFADAYDTGAPAFDAMPDHAYPAYTPLYAEEGLAEADAVLPSQPAGFRETRLIPAVASSTATDTTLATPADEPPVRVTTSRIDAAAAAAQQVAQAVETIEGGGAIATAAH